MVGVAAKAALGWLEKERLVKYNRPEGGGKGWCALRSSSSRSSSAGPSASMSTVFNFVCEHVYVTLNVCVFRKTSINHAALQIQINERCNHFPYMCSDIRSPRHLLRIALHASQQSRQFGSSAAKRCLLLSLWEPLPPSRNTAALLCECTACRALDWLAVKCWSGLSTQHVDSCRSFDRCQASGYLMRNALHHQSSTELRDP